MINMKRIMQNRKKLSLVLCLVLICVFTLSIAYSALNAVLTIQGNAEIAASDWNIYLNNPRVTSGSATTDVPIIKTNSTLEFSTTLNMPGDFYEFAVDVVNDGTIDAMIDNVVKTPELTIEQAKFLKYEVSYQNGESIANKQLLAKNSTMPIKVRVEYRKDLVASDLPTGQVVLDLSLTLEYIQSDGSGSSVIDNGVYNPYKIGNEKCINSECFYVISSNDNTVTMLAKYNLYAGIKVIDIDFEKYELKSETINYTLLRQNSDAIGYKGDNNVYNFPWIGTIPFSNSTKHGTKETDYSGSIVEEYVNKYKNTIESFGINVVSARLITKEELVDIFGCNESERTCKDSSYPWIYSTTYWTQSAEDSSYVWSVYSKGSFVGSWYSEEVEMGVRPVIVISKDYFN